MATRVAALWAALLIVLAVAVPVLAVEGPTKLDNPGVSPRTGNPTTTISFQVRYRNREGSAPDHVNVLIDGVPHRMTGGGSTWKSGVVLHWSTKLPAGTHSVAFEAADTRKFSDSIAGGSVTITVPASPTPSPTPTPKPTPKPTPTPKPPPTPAPTPKPTPHPTPSTAPTPGATPTGKPTSTPGAPAPDPSSPGTPGSTDGPGVPGAGGPGGRDTASGGFVPGGPGGGGPGSDGSGGSGAGPGVPGDTGGASTGSSGGSAANSGHVPGNRSVAGDAPGWGALARALEVLGVRRSTTTTVLPMLVGTTAATAMAFAFAIFGKKRRDEEPPAPDEVLQAQAARGHTRVPGGEVLGVVRAPAVAPLPDAEAGMPRWRRPSLIEARKADPARMAGGAVARMSFANAAVEAIAGHERRVIRYRVVRLLDAPDELRSADIGQLDQGDEVMLLERSGAYWLVLCPDGRQGWLHKMTLGEVVADASPQSWSTEIDDDVLSAFLSARARA